VLLLRDVAEMTGMSRSKVRSLVTTGTLRASRIGRQYLIRKSALRDLLDSHEVTGRGRDR